MFTLLGQKPLDVTLVAWFEGAYEDQSVYDKYAGASVTIDVELESNYNDMEAITFIDKTRGDKGENTPWIKTDDCIVTMQYKDTDATQKTVVMKYLGQVDGYNTWTAALPKDVTTDISFFRFSTTNNIIYNSWHTKENVNGELSPTAQGWIVNNEDLYPLQESRIVNGNRSLVYTAKRGNGYGKTDSTFERLSPCIGYWDYSPGGSTVETTTPSTTTPTSGGGSSEAPEINTGVYLDIPGNKQWLRDYLKSGDYKPYVVYKYEGKETNHLMQFESDGARCTLDNCSAPRGSRVIGFKFVNKKGTHTLLIPAKNEYIFSTPFNVSYEVTTMIPQRIINNAKYKKGGVTMKERFALLAAYFKEKFAIGKKSGKEKRKGLILSIVALVEVLAIAIVSVSAWVETISTIKLDLNNGTIDNYVFTNANIGYGNGYDGNTIDLTKYFRQAGDVHLASATSANGTDVYFRP